MFTEDLTVFFKDFGIDIAFRRESTPLFTATFIFDAPPSELAVYDRSFYDEKFYEARVANSDVTIQGVASEVASVQLNDIATVNAQDWFVTGIAPDGTGLISFILSLSKTT